MLLGVFSLLINNMPFKECVLYIVNCDELNDKLVTKRPSDNFLLNSTVMLQVSSMAHKYWGMAVSVHV